MISRWLCWRRTSTSLQLDLASTSLQLDLVFTSLQLDLASTLLQLDLASTPLQMDLASTSLQLDLASTSGPGPGPDLKGPCREVVVLWRDRTEGLVAGGRVDK